MGSLGEKDPTAGGVFVPEQFTAQILDYALEDELIRPRATIWGMTTDKRHIPAWAGSDHTANLYGGFVAHWPAEGVADTETAPKTREIILEAEEVAIFTSVADKLIEDGLSVGAQLETALRRAIGWFLDMKFLTGSGAGVPLGILNDPAIISVAEEGGQAADTIMYENVVNMFGRCYPSCAKRATWLATIGAVPQLLTLTLPIGVGGTPVRVLNEANGTYSMLTRPIEFTEKLPALGDKGDIISASTTWDCGRSS
jgi:HK97 family phage major capsid protein